MTRCENVGVCEHCKQEVGANHLCEQMIEHLEGKSLPPIDSVRPMRAVPNPDGPGYVVPGHPERGVYGADDVMVVTAKASPAARVAAQMAKLRTTK
jgi:hypothetical protein